MTAPRFLILADGDFGPMTSKTANSVIRYLPERTVGVLDRSLAGKTVAGCPWFRRRNSGGGLDARGTEAPPQRRAGWNRSAGRAAAGGVARLAGGSARRGLRSLEWAAHLPGRRPVARGQGQGGRPADIRPSAPSRRPARGLRGGQGRRPLRGPHRGNRLQRRKDDGAASARPGAQRRRPSHPVCPDRSDRHHDRRLGHCGGRGDLRLRRRRRRASGTTRGRGCGRGSGRRAGEHQSSRLLGRHAWACCTAPVPMP